MAENKKSVDSIRSFILEPEPNSSQQTYEPRRVEITVEPEVKNSTYLEEIRDNEPDREISFFTPPIQEVLNLDLTNASEEETLANNVQLRFILCRTTELLQEKTGLCSNLKKQIKTLELQTNSLKDLVAITKDLLSVRNMEVLSLHDEIRSLEEKIGREKDKHRHLLSNMNETVKAITKMKDEHRLQMDLSTEMLDDYKKKIEFLENEKKQLSGQICEGIILPSHITSEKVGEGDTSSDTQLPIMEPPSSPQ